MPPRHALAIARRDLREDLRSPRTWVLLGLFALLAGWVYVISLASFVDQSAEATMHPGQPINVNELLIRPFLLNLAIVVSFVLPLITIGAYSGDERRHVLDARVRSADAFAVAIGRFVRAVALYAAMLLLTLVDVAALSLYGRPEWWWIAGGYLGLLLMGAALIAVGLFLASLARNALIAAMPTFGLSLLLWTVKRVIAVSPTRAGSMLRDFSFADRFDDFAKGVVDGGHVVYFLSVALFGLLLTAHVIRAEARAMQSALSDVAPSPGSRVLAIVGWIGTALIAAAAGRFAALNPAWDRVLLWAAVAGAAGVLAYLASLWPLLAGAMQRGQPAVRSRTQVALVGALVVLAFANYFATKHSRRWDLTASAVYRPSPQMREVLKRLDALATIRLFARAPDLQRYRDRFDEYSKASDRVLVEYVDLDEQPAVARQYDVSTAGTVIVEYKNRAERLLAPSEDGLANALIEELEGTTSTIYFTIGHAERDIGSSERAGYREMANALRRANFAVEKINLAQQDEVPPDATLVVVAGPRTDFYRAEIEALSRYASGGGRMLVLIDPNEDLKRYITESGNALFMMDPAGPARGTDLTDLIGFVREWGIEVGADVIVDMSGLGQFFNTDASVPIGVTYPSHPMTEGFRLLTAYPLARSVSVRPRGGDTPSAQPFVETSSDTWAKADIKQLRAGKVSLNPAAGDRPGPISLGVAVSRPTSPGTVPWAGTRKERQSRETRIAVLGDSDFAANYLDNVPGNAELFLRLVAWLARRDPGVSIATRQLDERPLALTAAARRNLSVFAALALPLMMVSLTIYVCAAKGCRRP